MTFKSVLLRLDRRDGALQEHPGLVAVAQGDPLPCDPDEQPATDQWPDLVVLPSGFLAISEHVQLLNLGESLERLDQSGRSIQ